MARMTIGLIGLGRMGLGIGSRLVSDGHTVFGFDPSVTAQKSAATLGITPCSALAELATKTSIFWIMVPAGDPVDQVIATLLSSLTQGAIIIDGGNSHYSDSLRRHAYLEQHGIAYIDCGTSGGLHGQDNGYCLMVGGNKETFTIIEPLLKSIAAQNGYAYLGESGTGHYVKMVHNGIEYALLQSYAEGFQLLRKGHYKELDLAAISNVWNHGSIIRSWILELAENVLHHDQLFTNVSGSIGENKTGQWTLDEAQKHNIETPMVKNALDIRAWSRTTGGNYATKMVALLRKEFGGHPLAEKSSHATKK